MNTTVFRWLFLLLVILAAASLACGGSPAPVGESQGSVNESSNTIRVQAQEFAFALDALQAEAGEMTFIVENKGTMPHDFAIRGNGVEAATPHIEPGESATLTVALEPGQYTYECTIPGHAVLGMGGTLTVTSS